MTRSHYARAPDFRRLGRDRCPVLFQTGEVAGAVVSGVRVGVVVGVVVHAGGGRGGRACG